MQRNNKKTNLVYKTLLSNKEGRHIQNYDIYWCYKYFSQINTDQYRNKF